MRKLVSALSLCIYASVFVGNVEVYAGNLPAKAPVRSSNLDISSLSSGSNVGDSSSSFQSKGSKSNDMGASLTVDPSSLSASFKQSLTSFISSVSNDDFKFDLSLVSNDDLTSENRLFSGIQVGLNIPYIKKITDAKEGNFTYYNLNDGSHNKTFAISKSDSSMNYVYSNIKNFGLESSAGGGYVYTSSDGTRYIFEPSVSAPGSVYALSKMIDNKGRSISFEYDYSDPNSVSVTVYDNSGNILGSITKSGDRAQIDYRSPTGHILEDVITLSGGAGASSAVVSLTNPVGWTNTLSFVLDNLSSNFKYNISGARLYDGEQISLDYGEDDNVSYLVSDNGKSSTEKVGNGFHYVQGVHYKYNNPYIEDKDISYSLGQGNNYLGNNIQCSKGEFDSLVAAKDWMMECVFTQRLTNPSYRYPYSVSMVSDTKGYKVFNGSSIEDNYTYTNNMNFNYLHQLTRSDTLASSGGNNTNISSVVSTYDSSIYAASDYSKLANWYSKPIIGEEYTYDIYSSGNYGAGQPRIGYTTYGYSDKQYPGGLDSQIDALGDRAVFSYAPISVDKGYYAPLLMKKDIYVYGDSKNYEVSYNLNWLSRDVEGASYSMPTQGDVNVSYGGKQLSGSSASYETDGSSNEYGLGLSSTKSMLSNQTVGTNARITSTDAGYDISQL